MLKLIIVVLFFIILYFVWRMIIQPKTHAVDGLKQKITSKTILSDEDDVLPEKSQHIKEIREAEKTQQEQRESVVEVVEVLENEHDQRLFDEVAQLFFEKALRTQNIQQAEQIQQEFLNKMPAQTRSQIGEFDLGEWCIYWNYYNQSLEYYVGKYGIFYTHVDRFEIEHKEEFKIFN